MSERVKEAGVKPGFLNCTNPDCPCENPQPVSAFAAARTTTRGYSYNCRTCRRNYYLTTREHQLEQAKKRAAANPEMRRAKSQAYFEKNRDKILARNRAWHRANPERSKSLRESWQQSNQKKYRELQRQWRKANPLAMRAIWSRRRAKKVSAPGSHTANDIKKQFDSQSGKCFWCGCKLQVEGKSKYHVDHVVAISKGGSNGPENIVCACPPCNSAKSDKSPLEFAGRLF